MNNVIFLITHNYIISRISDISYLFNLSGKTYLPIRILGRFCLNLVAPADSCFQPVAATTVHVRILAGPDQHGYHRDVKHRGSPYLVMRGQESGTCLAAKDPNQGWSGTWESSDRLGDHNGSRSVAKSTIYRLLSSEMQCCAPHSSTVVQPLPT